MYVFNYLFIKEWLKMSGNSLNKLIGDINEMYTNFKSLIIFDRCIILHNYIKETGGNEVFKNLTGKEMPQGSIDMVVSAFNPIKRFYIKGIYKVYKILEHLTTRKTIAKKTYSLKSN